MSVGERMARIHQLDQPSSVHMGVNLGGGDVGMAEQGLQNPEISSSRQKVCGKRMAKDVRTDPLRCDPSIRCHLPDQLEQPHAAQMLLAAREQP